MVAYGQLRDLGPLHGGVEGKESVHLPVQANAFDHRGSIRFQGTTVIVEGHPGDFADHSVGQAAQKVPPNRRVHPLLPPTGHHVPALAQFVQEAWDVCRIVLQVSIKGDDRIVGCRIDAGLHRRGLSGVPPERNHPNPGFGVRNLTQDRKRPVGRTVIHEDHFNIEGQPLKHGPQLLTQRRQIGFLLEDRDHHRDGANGIWLHGRTHWGRINRRSIRFPSEMQYPRS